MEEYYHQVVELASQYFDFKQAKIFVLKETYCSFRIVLKDNLFIDVYHSSVSHRYVSQIKGVEIVIRRYDNRHGKPYLDKFKNPVFKKVGHIYNQYKLQKVDKN